jgi:1-acyl-sn-glycerol-3-phosphate acyltransferase
MIRLILVCIFLLIIFVLSLILFPIEWLIGRISPKAKDISSLRFVQFVFKVILFLSGVSTTVIGLENIPKDEPVVFIGNHRGFFDTVVSYSRMPRLTGFIAKKEMQKVPFIKLWMKYLHCLFMDRSNPREGLKTILSGIEQINNGISIVIFPEGTRNKGDGIMPFHGGSFKLADKSNCKIIPMVQNNTENVLEAHFPSIKRTHTILEFGTPIDT